MSFFTLSEHAVALSYLSDCAAAEFNLVHKNQSQRRTSVPASPGSQKP